jgi:hypothetical protein
VLAVLPRLTPETRFGLPAVRAYAARQGVSEEQYLAAFGAPVTPKRAGEAFLGLATSELDGAGAYVLTGEGLNALPAS